MKANQVGQDLSDLSVPAAGSNTDVDSSVERVVQGAHDSVNRMADAAKPAIQQLQDKVNASVDSLGDSADHARKLSEDGAESLRTLVRDRPLVALAAATVVGMLIARLAR